MTGSLPAGDADSISVKVAFLAAMPGVEQVIETHMAYVFLTEHFAYKLKKPVAFGYFDHRSLTARERACTEEVRLNRDLAGDVYIGTVPLSLAGGRHALWGQGRVVDWLVQMRRLPAVRMLDALILSGRPDAPSEQEIAEVAALLARFYRRQQRSLPPKGLYLAHLCREQSFNAQSLHDLARFVPGIPLAAVTSDLQTRIEEVGREIATREAAGQVVEGHGDLRPEHVCLTDPPVIFDRVETARDLRVIDVHDEVGYLAAECALMGRPDLGTCLLRDLEKAGFDPPSPALRTTFAVFRLVTRARLALDHLRDPAPHTPDKWPLRASAYLTEALRLSGLPFGQGVA